MISMYIEWDIDTIQSDGQYELEELQNKVDLLTRETNCTWDEDESAVFADSFIELKNLILSLSEAEWFVRIAKSWFVCNYGENDWTLDLFGLYAKEKKKPITFVMRIYFNDTKFKYSEVSKNEMIEQFDDYCQEYGIFSPTTNLFAVTSDDGYEIMWNLIFRMMEVENFLYYVNEWHLYYEDEKIDVLKSILRQKWEERQCSK